MKRNPILEMTAQLPESGTRVFRETPFGWWDKPTMRHLRRKYGHDKKVFCALRSVYLALCELDSDFVGKPINSFAKTVGTYAGTSRQVAGKYIRLLEEEGLVRQSGIRDPRTKKYQRGKIVEILSIEPAAAAREPMAGYPTSGVSHRRGIQPGIKKISMNKKKSMYNNVVENTGSENSDRAEYYAELVANELGDQASLSFYRATCRRFDGSRLLQKAKEIVKDGGARSPGAVFTAWVKNQEGLQ